VALITLFAGLCWRSFMGYPAPDNAIELSSPLQEGQFVVGHGGASPFINGHFKVKPQNYALDLLGVNAWGARSNIMGDPSQLHNYAIYGKPIVAPCDGLVVLARDGLPDLTPGETDRENLAGNHVVIECQGVEIILAHMLRGSVFVEKSRRVETGDFLGRVGNSGNTSEPHLHMHAEKGGEPGQILDGEPVPMLIDGKFLVRGNLLP
jgi:murein DD-endopeptidase MepM/ murein hydrolase activator NlpD